MSELTPIGQLVPLYVDDRIAGMDKKWAVRTIVRAMLARGNARGKGSRAIRRWTSIRRTP